MVRLIWSQSALDQLNDIAEYIALENPTAARELVSRCYEVVGRLSQFPESGKVVPEIPGFAFREVVVNPCRVFYKYELDQVDILVVMHQERDLLKFLKTFEV